MHMTHMHMTHSQILIAVLSMYGYPKHRIAKLIIISSGIVLAALFLYGTYRMIEGDTLAVLYLLLAFWLGLQTYQLYQAYDAGALENHTLFCGAESVNSSTSASRAVSMRMQTHPTARPTAVRASGVTSVSALEAQHPSSYPPVRRVRTSADAIPMPTAPTETHVCAAAMLAAAVALTMCPSCD